MTTAKLPVLTKLQAADYEELGYVHSIPILSRDEVRRYRAKIESTLRAIGDRVSRLDAAHLYFRWAWDLSTHPNLLEFMRQLLGPNILLKSTRLFYKHRRSASFVGWHQDGITEGLTEAYVPAIWLGLTAATVENGCVRVVPGSHHLGLIPHDDESDGENLTAQGRTAQARIDSPQEITMNAGEMLLLHPLVLHASNPNCSAGARIGFSATYSTPALHSSRTAIAWVCGDGPRHCFEVAQQPPSVSLDAAVAAYRAREHQILFAKAASERAEGTSGALNRIST